MNMSTGYHQVNSSASLEGELKGELFAGDHGPQGAWSSLKGPALTPPELSFSEQDTNYNDGRVDSNGMAPVTQSWTASVVTTGLTPPGGTLAK
jgi:hypothetical protein